MTQENTKQKAKRTKKDEEEAKGTGTSNKGDRYELQLPNRQLL